jgi:hypothetical protein
VALSHLFQAALDLGRHRGEAWFLDQMRRARGLFLAAPVERALALAGPLAVLRSLRDELTQLRGAMEGLARVGQPDSAKASSRLYTALSISEDSGRAVVCQGGRCRKQSARGTFCLRSIGFGSRSESKAALPRSSLSCASDGSIPWVRCRSADGMAPHHPAATIFAGRWQR